MWLGMASNASNDLAFNWMNSRVAHHLMFMLKPPEMTTSFENWVTSKYLRILDNFQITQAFDDLEWPPDDPSILWSWMTSRWPQHLMILNDLQMTPTCMLLKDLQITPAFAYLEWPPDDPNLYAFEWPPDDPSICWSWMTSRWAQHLMILHNLYRWPSIWGCMFPNSL